MVMLKRMLDNGFNGHHLPTIPKAPRSTRRRVLSQKTPEGGGGICAFELLATVAGKLLEESECSSASSSAAVGFEKYGIRKDANKKELQNVDKKLVGDHDEQGSSEGSVFFSGLQRDMSKGKLTSAIASSACSVKADSDSKLVIQKSNCEFVKLDGNIERNSPKCGESNDDTNIEEDIKGGTFGDYTMTNKSPPPTNSEENVGLPSSRNLKHENDVKIGCKDDDEILSGYSQPNSSTKVYKSPTTSIGDGKIKKLLTSKYWNTAPKLKDYEHSNKGGAVNKHIYHKKRSSYELDRSQRNTPFKKRKLFDRSSVVTYDGGISSESVSNSPEKSVEDEKNVSAGKLREGNGMSSSTFVHQKFCNSRNSHVQLSIKSFKVPELSIEVPESTTVGSLKRTVLDAVTTILGGGLRVGLLLNGKKIRDDNRTLLQTGIPQSNDMDSIGFMLEPDSPTTQPSQLIRSEDTRNPLPCDSPRFVNRSQVNRNEERFLLDTPDKPSMTDSNSPVGSTGDLFPFPLTEAGDKNGSDHKALVPAPEASTEALAVVPVNHRPKRCEMGQRRTRRPFSVSEVDALVGAVEKLGTGRWRDVKLCAFENVKHRTYVDLKDKWKTLVHTARISPQQRRGEPVPQELLDRVLAAQAYWSDHQAKQHGKQQQQAIIPKLTD